MNLDEENSKVWDKLARGLEGWTRTAPPSEANVVVTDSGDFESESCVQFIASDSETLSGEWSRGPFLREEHDLSDGLFFGGLLARFGESEALPNSKVLFRLGAQPPYIVKTSKLNGFSNMSGLQRL